MNYYRTTFFLIGLLIAGSVSAFIATTLWCEGEKTRLAAADRARQRAVEAQREAESEFLLRERRAAPLREFAQAWDSQLQPAEAKDLGNALRNGLTTLATRVGLTSEGATVSPEPRPYALAGRGIKVQQVSLKVVGESLPALLTWLGEVEARFAYARVESFAMSAYASHSVQMTVTLLHPVSQRGVLRETEQQTSTAPRR